MSSAIIPDASFMASMVLAEPTSQIARSLWEQWKVQGLQMHAPSLLLLEVGTSIRKHAVRGLISEASAARSLAAFNSLVQYISLAPLSELLTGAWDIATKYRLLNLYDASYLALAEAVDGEVWTIDVRMRRNMPEHAHKIRVVTPDV